MTACAGAGPATARRSSAVRAMAVGAALVALGPGGAGAVARCPDLAGVEEALIGGDVFILLTDFAGSAAKEGCVVSYIAAPPGAVMEILRDAGSYAEYMPRVASSEVTVSGDGEILNRQELDLPFPIGDRHFTISLNEERSDEGAYRLGFTYVPGSGNVDGTRGHWLVEPWRGGSRVTYVLWSDPGGAIPKWAINRASRKTLPDVMRALRQRVLERPAAAPDGDEDRPAS